MFFDEGVGGEAGGVEDADGGAEGLDVLGEIDAVAAAGQEDVGEQEVDVGVLGDEVNGLREVAGLEGSVAEFAEIGAGDVEEVGFVVYQEDFAA